MKATLKYFPLVLYNVRDHFEFIMKFKSVIIQMKATEQYAV